MFTTYVDDTKLHSISRQIQLTVHKLLRYDVDELCLIKFITTYYEGYEGYLTICKHIWYVTHFHIICNIRLCVAHGT